MKLWTFPPPRESPASAAHAFFTPDGGRSRLLISRSLRNPRSPSFQSPSRGLGIRRVVRSDTRKPSIGRPLDGNLVAHIATAITRQSAGRPPRGRGHREAPCTPCPQTFGSLKIVTTPARRRLWIRDESYKRVLLLLLAYHRVIVSPTAEIDGSRFTAAAERLWWLLYRLIYYITYDKCDG